MQEQKKKEISQKKQKKIKTYWKYIETKGGRITIYAKTGKKDLGKRKEKKSEKSEAEAQKHINIERRKIIVISR